MGLNNWQKSSDAQSIRVPELPLCFLAQCKKWERRKRQVSGHIEEEVGR